MTLLDLIVIALVIFLYPFLKFSVLSLPLAIVIMLIVERLLRGERL